VLLEADPDEVDDVGMVELAHDQSLHQEIHFGLKILKLVKVFI
jgi:hypothetical protein